jgi:hypothetical protein
VDDGTLFYFRPPWPVVEILITAHKKPRASRQKDQRYTPVRSAVIRSDTSQGLKALRKRHHKNSEEVNDSKRAVRIKQDQRKRRVHSPSNTLSEADLTTDRITRLLYHQSAKSDHEKRKKKMLR